MLTYLLIGLWISSTIGSPISSQNFKSTPLVYYTPTTSQYVHSNAYPFLQYPNESPAFGKALQSIQSQNELLFYPNPAVLPQVQQQQSVLVNQQTGNAPDTRFTAPPNGLVDAIYAWFAENNFPIPDDPSKNEASIGKIESNQERNEGTEKTAGEAEVLAEADRNPNLHFPKKPINPKFNPGQRFYILNGQPQFFGNYQPVIPRLQPLIPQLLTRSAIPSEPQNILILQSQPELQQQALNLKTQQPQEQTNQNVVLVPDQIQTDIKPVRYHSTELKPQNLAQNYVLLRENQQQENPANVQPLVPTYSRQPLLIGRLLPQTQDIKQQQVQSPIHQTHYVPVEVVPPQVPQFQTTQQLYQNQDVPQQDVNQQPHLAFIHIPVDRNIQPPQYITTKPQPIPLQHPTSGKQILFLSRESQHIKKRLEANENQIQQQTVADKQSDGSGDLAPGIAALEFARYIASRQGDIYSDTVVIDAKAEDDNNNKEPDDSEVVQADVPEEPSIAQAQPGGIALAGPGGVAATAPRGTALVGEKGLAVASPHATAVAGPNPTKDDKESIRS